MDNDFNANIINASCFFETAKLLDSKFNNKTKDIHPEFFVPAVVNYAIAIEITLKSIIKKYTGSYDYIHDIDKLYDALPNHSKTIVMLTMERVLKLNNEKLNENIKKIANCYNDWRYFVLNNKSLSINYNFLKVFAQTVCEVLVNIENMQITEII